MQNPLLNPDFHDILCEFCAANVEFPVVDAFALAKHGLLRATGNIDLRVRCSQENADRIMAALIRFGAPLSEVSAADFITPGMVYQIGIAPRCIDVLTEIDGVTFDEAWQDRIYHQTEGLTIPVISRQHLLRNKRAIGRPKDAADAAWLEQGEDRTS